MKPQQNKTPLGVNKTLSSPRAVGPVGRRLGQGYTKVWVPPDIHISGISLIIDRLTASRSVHPVAAMVRRNSAVI